MLYGAIFGDMAGSTYEFRPTNSLTPALITDKMRFTDDSVMTMAVASWLMKDRKQETLIKELQYFGGRYPRAGYGGMFRKWLVDDDPEPYNSFGNGSAMRVSPCGWVAETLDEAMHLAKKSAMVTHNHPEGIKGAQAVAGCIYIARYGGTKEEIKSFVEHTFGYNLDRTVEEIRNSGYKFNETCQGSVPEAIICFLESKDFEDCVTKAITLRGDADTQACIAGSIAEAYYGIPGKYIGIVDKKLDTYLIEILDKFNKTYE